MSLKNKLNHLKQIKQSTSQDIIDITNIPKGTLDKLLTGVTANPRMDTVRLLAKYFDVTLDYLIDDDITIFDIRYKDLEKNQLFKTYNNLSPDKKNVLIGYLDRLLDED